LILKAGYTEKNLAVIDRCKKGDNEAFRELYSSYARAMFSTCMRMLNNKEDAEDILQESFISAFRNISQYKANASFGSWLKRIVINNCIDFIKRSRNGYIPLEEIDPADEEPAEEIKYDAAAIKESVQELPDGFRIILTLYLFEDHSHRMIAEKLGISEGTSKSQYSRARKKLAEIIRQKTKFHER
jgi:RNA polymerase sigma factor (sigma-70 family)